MKTPEREAKAAHLATLEREAKVAQKLVEKAEDVDTKGGYLLVWTDLLADAAELRRELREAR